ncbi:unnamed protein product [Angiostrongylus costaricensis]|uniref:Uncharacterized protein n=1 Tax=Angiostrongylus costaricensis TaxID=334426 RepID=A0A158PJG1_ANGCS|nr:unnamed protein product [Angiostrongylus costaricensis]
MKRIAMTEEQYRKVEQLHYGWYVQAVRALLGAVGKELYMKMDRNNRRAFVACLDSIDNEHDLQLGSQFRTASSLDIHGFTSFESKEVKRERQFKYRMLDMVLGKDNPFRKKKSFTERFRDLVPERMVDESVFDLVDSVFRHTTDVNQQFLSPRILPLLPDKYRASKSLLSPDLFPFYKDDADNTILPIPEVLEKSGLSQKDRISVLELIMDVSGVNDVVEEAIDLVNNMKRVGLGMDLMSITSKIDEVFIDLANSLEASQRRELARHQYSFLTKSQMLKLYGEKGIFNTTVADLPFNIDEFSSLSRSEREESLRNTIRLLAKDPRALHYRSKRAIEIRHFRHATLAPFSFAPTFTALNVLGPVTLSPSLFSPSIISPLLLSPPVLSPQVGNPLIFSPYVLGPNVLSAAVFNAYVFSPYVLSPNVINPYVLSPLILSPFVLCPDVLSPTVLSGVVLSPSAFSPSIFTDSALALNILSPTFMS